MVRLTLIARVIDGLPLAASMEDEQTDRDLAEYKQMAKMLFKKLNEMSPTRQSLETQGPYVFHYAIEAGVCYLVLCEKTFPANLAFAYLDDLQAQFQKQFGAEINTVARPYAFISFDTFIQKTKRNYLDTRGGAKNVSRLNNELRDVQRIMMQNIDDVLGRGEKIDNLHNKASNLKEMSRKYAQDAKELNWKAFLRKWGPLAAVSFVVLILLYVRFF